MRTVLSIMRAAAAARFPAAIVCPPLISLCVSGILKLVLPELDFFLEKRVPQVKFVDRTFNAKKSHAMAIWKHILEHDNGVTNFHFEIAADLLDEEELELISRMRPGLIQLEIGVQSTNHGYNPGNPPENGSETACAMWWSGSMPEKMYISIWI